MDRMDYFRKALAKKYEQKHYQQLHSALSFEKDCGMLHFNTQDFLGLSTHPYVQKETIEAVKRWGAGSTSARFLPDHINAQLTLENRLAALLNVEAVILFPSNFAAQNTLFTCLSNVTATLFFESAYSMQRAKGFLNKKSTVHSFDRKSLNALPDGKEPKIIIASSICPSTGEIIDLRSFMAHAVENDALLLVDDTHAMGVLGQRGLGLAANRKGVDIVMGSFGKITGSFGAYIGCSKLIKDYIIAHAHIDPLPPANLGAMSAGLELIPDMDAERVKILNLAKTLRSKLKLAGFDVFDSKSHIVGVQTNEPLSEMLAEEHIIAMPNATPGIAFNLCIQHSEEQMNLLVKTLGKRALSPV